MGETSRISQAAHKDSPALITVGLLKNPSCLNALLYFQNKLLLSLVLLLFSADYKLFHREERLGQNLDGHAGYTWLIHRLLPVIAKECGTVHRGGQGRRLTSKSACTTQDYGYRLPWQCTTGYTELYACDGWDKQNSSRTSSLVRYLHRKQKVNRQAFHLLSDGN